MVAKLLASSGSVEGIQGLINRFWATNRYTVDPQTLEIGHPDPDRAASVRRRYRVTLRKGRYRFECVPEES